MADGGVSSMEQAKSVFKTLSPEERKLYNADRAAGADPIAAIGKALERRSKPAKASPGAAPAPAAEPPPEEDRATRRKGQSFAKNLGEDVTELAEGVANLPSVLKREVTSAAPYRNADRYHTAREEGGSVLDGVTAWLGGNVHDAGSIAKDAAKSMAKTVAHPVDTMHDEPLEALGNLGALLPAGWLAGKGVLGAGKAAAASAPAKRVAARALEVGATAVEKSPMLAGGSIGGAVGFPGGGAVIAEGLAGDAAKAAGAKLRGRAAALRGETPAPAPTGIPEHLERAWRELGQDPALFGAPDADAPVLTGAPPPKRPPVRFAAPVDDVPAPPRPSSSPVPQVDAGAPPTPMTPEAMRAAALQQLAQQGQWARSAVDLAGEVSRLPGPQRAAAIQQIAQARGAPFAKQVAKEAGLSTKSLGLR